MANKKIHPKQHEVTIEMTDGSKFNIMTTWGKAGETLKLDVDPKNHQAWQEGNKSFINVNDERVNKFNKKFGNFFSTENNEPKKEEPKKEEAKKA